MQIRHRIDAVGISLTAQSCSACFGAVQAETRSPSGRSCAAPVDMTALDGCAACSASVQSGQRDTQG